jgi:serine/threonine protein kinase
MAPEQSSGGTVTPAVDLYALGLVLDEMLGGSAASGLDVAPAADAYVPPSTVSAPLAALLVRLCASDPAARPATSAEVVDELEALLAEARVRTKRSPRELLAHDVAALRPPRDASEDEPSVADFRTDASFVTEGESETFARRMRPDDSPRSEPRHTPLPPRPPSSPWPWRVAPLAISLVILAFAFQLVRSREPEPIASDAPSEAAPTPHAQPSPATDAPTTPAETPIGVSTVPTAETPTRRAPARPAPTTTAPIPATTVEVVVEAPALVRLNARPWADVTIDGRASGVTPLVRVALTPGGHDIVFTNPALGVTRTEHVELVSGEQRDVIVDLRTPP